MPQSYDPNLGVLSAFEGVGSAISDIGRMGMTDSMETRRSKMEHELRRQLKGEDQEFTTEQAELEDVRKVKAATVKHGRDVELAGVKAGTKGKDSDKYELVTATGTPLKYDDVRKAWSNQVGADLESFDPNAAMTFENYIKGRGIRYRTDAPPAPVEPVVLDEAAYRERYFGKYPDADEEEYQQDLMRDRKSGNVSAGKAEKQANIVPGVMDAMAADADQAAGDGQFAGGEPQGQPGVLAETEESIAPGTDYAKMGQAMESERVASAQRDTIQDRLLKHREKAVKSSRQVGRKAAKKEVEKVEKAAKQVEAALQKGNINQVSKDSLKIALNNQSFVDGLSEEELQTLIDYLEQ